MKKLSEQGMRFFYTCKNIFDYFFTRQTFGARILLIKDDRVLLVKHSYQPGWYTIGGGIEKGESPLVAIKREIKEEVGVTLLNSPVIFSVYYSTFQQRDNYIVLYLSSDFLEEPSSSPEIAEKKWFSLNDLPADVTSVTKRRIDEYLRKRAIDDKW